MRVALISTGLRRLEGVGTTDSPSPCAAPGGPPLPAYTPPRSEAPPYRARRLLTKAHERLDERGDTRLRGLLEAGDPRGEVRMTWHAKEVVRSIDEITDAELAGEFVDQLGLISKTTPARLRSVRWVAPSCGGGIRSRLGTERW
jgi:hypothetical protein